MRAAEMIADAENALRMLEECENEDDFRARFLGNIILTIRLSISLFPTEKPCKYKQIKSTFNTSSQENSANIAISFLTIFLFQRISMRKLDSFNS